MALLTFPMAFGSEESSLARVVLLAAEVFLSGVAASVELMAESVPLPLPFPLPPLPSDGGGGLAAEDDDDDDAPDGADAVEPEDFAMIDKSPVHYKLFFLSSPFFQAVSNSTVNVVRVEASVLLCVRTASAVSVQISQESVLYVRFTFTSVESTPAHTKKDVTYVHPTSIAHKDAAEGC